MSAFNEVDVTCSSCGEEFRGTVWTAVHAKLDPELKELLLGGELNLLPCTKCSNVSFYEHFLLYQDPRLKLVAYVYPIGEEEREKDLQMEMVRGFAEAQEALEPKDRLSYAPRLVFGLASLVEMINEEEVIVLAQEVEEARLAVEKTGKINSDSISK